MVLKSRVKTQPAVVTLLAAVQSSGTQRKEVKEKQLKMEEQ